MSRKKPLFFILIVLLFGILSCQTASDLINPEPEIEYVTEVITEEVEIEGEVIYVTETVVVTVEIEVTQEPIIVTEIVIEEPAIDYPDTLVICLGQEPDNLYTYGGDMLASAQVQEALYDGPIDNRSFGYQAVLLEKIPSLADGDAVLRPVDVSAGDLISVGGAAKDLEVGDRIRPSGCRSADCEINYSGGTVEMDQIVVTFSLLPNLMWDDGEPLTASDSVYAFYLADDPDTPVSKYTTYRTESYEAVDDLTIVWTGIPGYMDSTYFINFFAPLPEHIYGQYTALELLQAYASSVSPTGYGPYRMVDWDSGYSITLEKNPYYHRADEGLPYFDTLVYRFVGENSNANIAALLAGECDILDQTSALDDESELLLELQNAGDLTASFVTGTVWEHADFGIVPASYDDGYNASIDRPKIFDDVRTRQAIAICMDRQAVIDTVLLGQSIVLDTYLPPQHPLFNADVTHYDYDPDFGSELLEEVGWTDTDGDGIREAYGIDGVPNGTLLEFEYWTTNATMRQQVTQILAETMAECGIKANLEYWNAGEYFADGPDGPLFGRYYDLGEFAWLTSVEPPCDLYLSDQVPTDENGWAGQNNTGWSNAGYDTACNAALSSLPGENAYMENHLLAQEIFAEELPVIPLFLRLKLAATRPDMCGFFMDPTENSEMWNIEEFGYGPWCD